ncbi:MAG TPA: 5'/3'-nucleotidase SurE [Micromonosporaceae bacterium]|nr:5'/3'-nucleotidase SurE [Micromonosporaceae bacterium]
MNRRPAPVALITNDDGIDADGLRWLALAARDAGFAPVIAAPLTESSGIGAGLRAAEEGGRILVEQRVLDGLDGVPTFAVAATPAYIALLGSRGAFGAEPEVLLSGINHGPNTGRALLHSGTAGAAMTAISDGLRAMAFSLDFGWRDDAAPRWDTAVRVATTLLDLVRTLPPGSMLNVNVPNVPMADVRGVRRATLAEFGAVQMTMLEQGEGYVRMSLSESGAELHPGSDEGLLEQGYVTVTPLRPLAAADDVRLHDLPDLDTGRLP